MDKQIQNRDTNDSWHRWRVRVTTALGVVHSEHPTNSLDDADAYARDAIADHCLQAEVVAINAKGHLSGEIVSTWDRSRWQAWADRRADDRLL